jgi:hypothetical protein
VMPYIEVLRQLPLIRKVNPGINLDVQYQDLLQ